VRAARVCGISETLESHNYRILAAVNQLITLAPRPLNCWLHWNSRRSDRLPVCRPVSWLSSKGPVLEDAPRLLDQSFQNPSKRCQRMNE
jgi:hypothetical protein